MRTFVFVTILLALFVGYAAGGKRGSSSDTAQPAEPTQRTVQYGALTPPERQTAPGTAQIDRGLGGHFTVAGDIAGTPMTFIVDTGASRVALSRNDAKRAGIWVADGDFTGQAQTANATVRVASRILPRVRVGSIELYDVSALILDVPEAAPLLGQSFLNRVDKVAIEGSRMTLTKL